MSSPQEWVPPSPSPPERVCPGIISSQGRWFCPKPNGCTKLRGHTPQPALIHLPPHGNRHRPTARSQQVWRGLESAGTTQHAGESSLPAGFYGPTARQAAQRPRWARGLSGTDTGFAWDASATHPDDTFWKGLEGPFSLLQVPFLPPWL